MSKQIKYILAVFFLTLLLGACGEEPVGQTTLPAETTTPSATLTQEETTLPRETAVPVATTVSTEVPAPTGTPTEPEAAELPYQQPIHHADQSIYDGPGYDYVFVGTVREKGTYTIVEEVRDYEGNLWGRLKSGAGWVDLTQIRSPEYAESLISANYADEYLLQHGAFHYCPCEESEYCSTIAFRAYGTLRNVEIFAYELRNDGFFPGDPFFFLEEWTADMPLVAELSFPGDMSTYGIRFIDETGISHVFEICISGRNGSLILSEQ